jgi:hypothetical protein
MMGDLHGRLGVWWDRLRWWSAEAKATRAFRQYGARVRYDIRCAGFDDAGAEELTHRAFLALGLEYAAGRSIENPRKFALEFVRAAVRKALQ